MDVKGIAGSPGAVNIFTSDIDPGICHEFSMSKNEYWVLGAMPGSPVILALMKSWDVKSKEVLLASTLVGRGWCKRESTRHMSEATPSRFGSPALDTSAGSIMDGADDAAEVWDAVGAKEIVVAIAQAAEAEDVAGGHDATEA
jgi:hypothetical protein